MGIVDFFFGKKIDQKVAEGIQKLVVQQNKKTSSHGYSSGYYNSLSGGAKWPGGLSTSHSYTAIDHSRTMAAARNMMQDAPVGRAMVERARDTQIDTGLTLEAIPKASILGITPEQAEEWGRDVSARFALWAKEKTAHRSGLCNFYQLQRMYALAQHRDGDMFTRLYYNSRRDLISPLQLEFLDPGQIRGNGYTVANYPIQTEDGIIRNEAREEIGYKVTIQKGAGKTEDLQIPRVGRRSGRVNMLHGFTPEYAGQGRGFTRLAGMLQELENTTDYGAAAIKKAISQSQFAMAVENNQMAPSNPLEDNLRMLQGSYDPNTQEEQVIDTGKSFEVCPLPEGTFDVPGTTGVFNLQRGDTIKMLETKNNAEGYEAFITPFISILAASLGQPVTWLLMKFNANYSASRAEIIAAYKTAKIWLAEMNADFNNPIYAAWLSEEIAAGRVAAPGWQDPRLRAAWLNCNWIGAPMPSIDPAKDAKAAKDLITIGATNQNRVAREYNGSSAEENIAINNKYFSITPVPPWEGGGGQTEEPEAKDEEQEEDDNGE